MDFTPVKATCVKWLITRTTFTCFITNRHRPLFYFLIQIIDYALKIENINIYYLTLTFRVFRISLVLKFITALHKSVLYVLKEKFIK